MEEIEEQIKNIYQKLQQRLKEDTAIQKTAAELKQENETLRKEKTELEKDIQHLTLQISMLKAMKSTLPESEKEELRISLSQYIKEIEKTIQLLSE